MCDKWRSVPGSPPAWQCRQTCHAAPLCCSPDAQCLCDALQSHSALVWRSLNPRSTTQTADFSWCSMNRHIQQRFWKCGEFCSVYRELSQDLVETESRSCGLGFERLMWPESHQYGLRQSSHIQITTSQAVAWPVKRLQQIPQREHYVKSNMLHCYIVISNIK